MKTVKVVIGVLASMASMSVFADAIDIQQVQLTPMSQSRLALYRGGFQINRDYVINIGLSVRSSVNGQSVFNTQIANLVFENGQLLKQSANYKVRQANPTDSSTATTAVPVTDVVNVVQVGEGNQIAGDVSVNPAALVNSLDVTNSTSASITSASITNVIQNTLDHSVLGVDTIVNIDAQVSGLVQQIRSRTKLQDALLIGGY
ncbi:hypothetical protein H4F18_03840 [Vibrio scophthalmi]|uniref:hypothetical protein n=1 Tax=Vibrio scophthalmi TaxID=45658 RepID=UPI002FEE96AF